MPNAIIYLLLLFISSYSVITAHLIVKTDLSTDFSPIEQKALADLLKESMSTDKVVIDAELNASPFSHREKFLRSQINRVEVLASIRPKLEIHYVPSTL